MNINNEDIQEFQKKVFSFYVKQKRNLPWRKTRDPYKILLSELMLQQTQVSRVIEYYKSWIKQWPTISSLANARRPQVLSKWMGLGYNNRATRLHIASKKIVQDYNSDVLQALNHYEEIPGVGKYTAHAVHIFATNADMVTIDTNIRRILINEFQLPKDISESELWDLALDCLPKGKSREWHNALMDYGALQMTSRSTGISPRTKQSRFEGSDRQQRARILRLLLQQPMSFLELGKAMKINRIRLKTIIEKMKKDKLLLQKNNIYYVYE
jgi:A/G-specific adenine glycosylase